MTQVQHQDETSAAVAAPISVQLYSLREQAAVDLPGVLGRLGEIGFVGVETAGLYGLPPRELRRMVEDAGMVISSTHAALPVGERAAQVLEEQADLGTPLLITGLGPADFATRDTVLKAAESFAAAAENAAAVGIQVGYHNHWWEFETVIAGRPAYDVFLEATDPRVFAQVDTYWVQTAGMDAAAVVAGLGERARSLHIKDGPGVKGQPHVAVGAGVMAIPAVIAAGAAAGYHVVELDECATDMMTAVEGSHNYLVGSGLSRGRQAVAP